MNELEQHRPVECLTLADAVLASENLVTVNVAPDGEVKSTQGNFVVDDEAAGLIVGSFDAHGVDVPIDYEHQTLGGKYSAPSGRAPAAGWIKKLWREPGTGLQALVCWNGTTRDAIREGSYRYLSPVLMVRKADQRAVALHSAALTNKPAIVGMSRVAASDRLAEQVNAAVIANPEEAKAAMDRLRELLGASEEAKLAELLAAAVAKLEELMKGDVTEDKEPAEPVANAVPPAGFVAQADYDKVVASERELREEHRGGEVDELLDRYTLQNKLNPHNDKQMTLARAHAMRDPQGFAEWMEAATPIVAAGRTTAPERPESGRVQIIAKARAEFRQDGSLAKATSESAFVSLRLQERGLARLSEDEARQYDLVVA